MIKEERGSRGLAVGRGQVKGVKLYRKPKPGQSFGENFPELSKEYHATKNAPFTVYDITKSSGEPRWWICSKGHIWEAPPNRRAYGKGGCPYCTSRFVDKTNCVATTHPHLLLEWDDGDLSPYSVTSGSGKEVWWRCQNCDQRWKAKVSNWSKKEPTGCPFCVGHGHAKKVHLGNSIEKTHPHVAAYLHPNMNDRLSSQISAGSNTEVWWYRKECGHEWLRTPCQMVAFSEQVECFNGTTEFLETYRSVCTSWGGPEWYKSQYEMLFEHVRKQVFSHLHEKANMPYKEITVLCSWAENCLITNCPCGCRRETLSTLSKAKVLVENDPAPDRSMDDKWKIAIRKVKEAGREESLKKKFESGKISSTAHALQNLPLRMPGEDSVQYRLRVLHSLKCFFEADVSKSDLTGDDVTAEAMQEIYKVVCNAIEAHERIEKIRRKSA